MIRVTGRAGFRAAIAALLIAAAAGPVRARAAGGDEEDKAPLVVIADLNHDGIADMVEARPPAGGSQNGELRISLGEQGGGFRLVSARPVLGRSPRAIVTGDFNGDGIPDVIVGDDDGSLRLFLGDGKGGLVRGEDAGGLDSVVSIAVADFDRDGKADIAVSDWRGGAVTIFLGDGKGSFRRGWSFPLRMPGTFARVSAADFNGDGIPDLAVVYGDDDGYTFDVMLGDGNGVFVRSPELSFAQDPNAHCPA